MQNQSIKNKKILMFAPCFFGYREIISEHLKEIGCQVDLYDERPNNSAFCKIMLRYNVKLYHPIVMKYYLSVIEENKDKDYDYILVIKSEAINPQIFNKLKEAYPNAEFILYLWDSVENVPDGENKIKLYDRVLTFDPVDAEKYQIPFLPIPYGKEYTKYENNADYKYDVAFIGTAHSVRPRVVKQIKQQCEKMGRKCFTYFYSPHILVYLFNKLTNKDYRYISLKEINFDSLSTEEVCQIYNASKCVLDIEHPKQHGTTTRPVEMLPMKKKIITTNICVKNFDFYSDKNFLIIDRDNPIIEESFFESEYIPVGQDLLYKYSPKKFVETLFEIQ